MDWPPCPETSSLPLLADISEINFFPPVIYHPVVWRGKRSTLWLQALLHAWPSQRICRRLYLGIFAVFPFFLVSTFTLLRFPQETESLTI